MEINADFSQRVVVHAAGLPWTPSPTPGVERRMLDRIGGEVARATSLVRYAPQSSFPPHTHGGGEEFLVLDGVFQDERGDYPAGTYVRTPPTSRHAPGSATGCTIFVKLWQFDTDDRQCVVLGTADAAMSPLPERPGVTGMGLFADARETVSVESWAAGTAIELPSPAGLELLVIDGGCHVGNDRLQVLSWLRMPAGDALRATAGDSGCRVWLKTGHLNVPTHAPPAA